VTALSGPMRELGPYAAIALIVPGGTLIALGMWAFRHRAGIAQHLGRVVVVIAAMAVALVYPRAS
jgi:hypothetical protein